MASNNTIPMINGIMYSWSQVTLVLFGNPVIGITSINYGQKQEKANLWGIGQQPIGRTQSNISYEASITLYLDEWRQIIAASPNNDPTQIPPFSMQVVYSATTRNNAQTDVLKYVEFLENPVKTNQGDGQILVTLPLIVGSILYEI